MVQFNLLPDIKKEYVKARRLKRLIMTVSVIAAGASLGVVVLMFSYVQVVQKQDIDNITEDIQAERRALESVNDLNKILTIQNQLAELPALHQAKPETSRIFSILTQVTPADIKIQSVELGIVDQSMSLSGSASDLASINRYADTLKFARFNTQDTNGLVPFPSVVTSLSRSGNTASYTIDLTFDPLLFDNTQDIVMVVPEQVTTRSTLGKPDLSDQGDNQLFEDNPEVEN